MRAGSPDERANERTRFRLSEVPNLCPAKQSERFSAVPIGGLKGAAARRPPAVLPLEGNGPAFSARNGAGRESECEA
ncbi:hypothetical protein [Caproicibacter sp. BJN0012]|uniref:hypothetical protein n=1 Tax=Caproicibacter sp. BJN0012 TaxID=3110227 RepID=UPI002E15D9F2